jgi:hypothetical protein
VEGGREVRERGEGEREGGRNEDQFIESDGLKMIVIEKGK